MHQEQFTCEHCGLEQKKSEKNRALSNEDAWSCLRCRYNSDGSNFAYGKVNYMADYSFAKQTPNCVTCKHWQVLHGVRDDGALGRCNKYQGTPIQAIKYDRYDPSWRDPEIYKPLGEFGSGININGCFMMAPLKQSTETEVFYATGAPFSCDHYERLEQYKVMRRLKLPYDKQSLVGKTTQDGRVGFTLVKYMTNDPDTNKAMGENDQIKHYAVGNYLLLYGGLYLNGIEVFNQNLEHIVSFAHKPFGFSHYHETIVAIGEVMHNNNLRIWKNTIFSKPIECLIDAKLSRTIHINPSGSSLILQYPFKGDQHIEVNLELKYRNRWFGLTKKQLPLEISEFLACEHLCFIGPDKAAIINDKVFKLCEKNTEWTVVSEKKIQCDRIVSLAKLEDNLLLIGSEQLSQDEYGNEKVASRKVHFVDVSNRQKVKINSMPIDTPIEKVHISPSGEYLFIGREDGQPTLFRRKQQQLVAISGCGLLSTTKIQWLSDDRIAHINPYGVIEFFQLSF